MLSDETTRSRIEWTARVGGNPIDNVASIDQLWVNAESPMHIYRIQAVAVLLTCCAPLNVGYAQEDKNPVPQEIKLTVPGEWRSRPSGDDKAKWVGQKTPATIRIEPGHDYAFDLRGATDKNLADLAVLKDVPLVSLGLPLAVVTDQGVAHLKQLKVGFLTLASSRLTDEGVAHLADIRGLQGVYLSACGTVTDKGLAHLKKVKGLKQVWITANRRITDEGLKSIAEMNNLEWLSLFGCERITDKGVAHLKLCKKLKFAFFGRTAVTDHGVKELKNALPDCDVKR
jgi:hypothetical protein